MQFITKNKSLNKINVEHGNTIIIHTNFVKLFSITVYNTLSWKQYINTIIPKLNNACYVIRSCKMYLSHAALKIMYYAFLHSVMSCGVIFWENSTNSKCIFKLQKRAIRIIVGAKNNDSSREILNY
jgi:hypothetical protein